MADKLKFELVTPERLLLSEEVDMVTVPGTEGDFGVLAGHAPVMSAIRPGMIDVLNDGKRSRILVYGGFADVTPAGLTVLAEQAVAEEDLDRASLDQAILDAEEDIGLAGPDQEAAQAARERLDHLKAARDALG
ncbi:MAG: F0F1 ATP synthase subunit epsilon [Alphaproteobacteria bacterium]|nr:F0F1 ATP synthase subunit epsilon [Alphaproteobacteria bacterium]